MAPRREIFPVPAVRVRFDAPSIDPLKVISPTPGPVLREAGEGTSIAEAKLIGSFVVLIDPPKATDPAPL